MAKRFAIVLLAACGSSPVVAPVPAPVKTAKAPVDPACLPPAVEDTPAAEEEVGEEPRAKPAPVRNACTVDGVNLAHEAAAILEAHSGAKPVARVAWNHKTAPARLAEVKRRFELDAGEIGRLYQTGVVAPARLEQPSYAYAYHEIFQSQLPVYVTADSLFHAVFASHDAIVEALEKKSIAPDLGAALAKMHCALVGASADYPEDTARDLDLYLTVARSLLDENRVHSARGDAGVEREADAILGWIEAAKEVKAIEVFGRVRLVDFTQFQPRGHYAKEGYEGEDLQRYFRAAMWASRVELNVVSRGSRSSAPGPEPDGRETPREAIDALALANLVGRSGAGAQLGRVERAWTMLAGKREDVTVAQMAELRKTAGIGSLREASAFAKLKAAIGERFGRTTRLHPMPEGSGALPVIATLIGPRVVADATALMPVVHGAVANRKMVQSADVAYSFGLDHAKRYLAGDLTRFPGLAEGLEAARAIASKAPDGPDLYAAWYAAIRALGKKPDGALPSFLASEVGDDLRMNTVTAAFGQLKHNYVLMAGQPYSEFGCEIPDGYVEPAPAAYDALIAYAERGAALASELDAEGWTKAYFDRLAATLRVLRAIVDDELANRPLSAVQKQWLGMVAELGVDKTVETTGYPPTYAGWYLDLFPDAERDGMRGAGFVADYFTSAEEGIAYVGASAPRMAIFVVDTGGAPRAFVGPIARGYEVHTPLTTRLTDDTAAQLTAVEEPWAASYTVAVKAAAPRLRVHLDRETGTLTLTAPAALGAATIKALDHHRVAIAQQRVTIGEGETEVRFGKRAKIGAVYVQIGAWRDWVVGDSYDEINGAWNQPTEE